MNNKLIDIDPQGRWQGEYKDFHGNGKVWEHSTYKNNKLEGEAKYYDFNGMLKYNSNYKNHLKDGEVLYYLKFYGEI